MAYAPPLINLLSDSANCSSDRCHRRSSCLWHYHLQCRILSVFHLGYPERWYQCDIRNSIGSTLHVQCPTNLEQWNHLCVWYVPRSLVLGERPTNDAFAGFEDDFADAETSKSFTANPLQNKNAVEFHAVEFHA